MLILPSMKAGGAERVLSYLAKNLDPTLFKVRLLIIGFKKDSVYNINELDVQFLNKKRLVFCFYPLILAIINFKPRIVMSSIVHVNIFTGLISLFFRKTKFIAREASVLSIMGAFDKRNNMLNFLSKYVYHNFSRIICQSNDMLLDLKKTYKISEKKLIVINNPITQSVKVKIKRENLPPVIRFITIGRLSKEKGHERILKCLASSEIKNYHYKIIGDGILKNHLLKVIAELKLEKKVSFISYTSEVFEELRSSHIFLQGSFVEGFPNAVLESCIVGTPVIAFEAPGGTKEIIKKNTNGILAKDEKEFISILNSDINRLLYWNPLSISESVKAKFSSKKILNQYQELFISILK